MLLKFVGKSFDLLSDYMSICHFLRYILKDISVCQVSMVSRLKHENVVELLGYCVEGNLRVLAYEFATMGSLHDILHGMCSSCLLASYTLCIAGKLLDSLDDETFPFLMLQQAEREYKEHSLVQCLTGCSG